MSTEEFLLLASAAVFWISVWQTRQTEKLLHKARVVNARTLYLLASSSNQVRNVSEWRPADGPVVWWTAEVDCPMWYGRPTDEDFPAGLTQWAAYKSTSQT